MLQKINSVISSPRTQIIFGLVLLFFGLISFATLLSMRSVEQLQIGNIDAATNSAKLARYPVELLSLTTLRTVPDIETWRYSLILLSNSTHYFNDITKAINPNDDAIIDLNTASIVVGEVNSVLQPLAENLEHATLLPKIIEHRTPNFSVSLITKTAALLKNITPIFQHLPSKDQTWIILLQNSDEIRATGGFAGSYIKIPIQNGLVTELIVEDIYDTDGQFEGYIEAPPGVAEYLSGNNGLRLPDANWFPDYRQSSEQMLQFFSHSTSTPVEGIIAINLPLVEKLLTITGPLEVPDYQATLTADSLSTLLRSERDEFFPGSKQKKHMLSLAMQQFKLSLENLSPSQYETVLSTLKKEAAAKNILAYSTNKPIQDMFSQLKLDGQVTSYNASDYLYLIESNVGINKANKGIEREVWVDWEPTTVTIQVEFTNNNFPKTESEIAAITENNLSEALHNGYVNYQRILVLPEWELEEIIFNNEPITNYQEDTITTPEGDQFKQIGFLVTLPEQEQKQLQLNFSKPEFSSPENLKPLLTIQKQPGLASIPYTITSPINKRQFKLEKDTTFTLPEIIDPAEIPLLY